MALTRLQKIVYSKRSRGALLEKQDSNTTILFNKPRNVVSSFTTDWHQSHGTLSEYINIPHIYACGRLDRTSEGLLVLSSSRYLSSAITSPNHYIEKTYYVHIEGNIEDEKIDILRNGITLDNHKTLPCTIERVEGLPDSISVPRLDKDTDPNCTWIRIHLKEGINRQIRRMVSSVGYHTVRIVRSSVGKFTLDQTITPGTFKKVEQEEMSTFWKDFYCSKYKGN